MASWLGTDALPIGAGWASEPQLSAPNIGELTRAILQNRQWQQENTQSNVANAIKQIQSQRQAGAYGQALQSSGVVPQGVDVSNMSGPDLSKLAALYQETIPDTDLDKLRQAMAKRENAMADWVSQGKPSAGVDFSEHNVGDIYTDPDTGIRMIMTSRGPRTVAGWGQPTDVKTQNQNQILTEQNQLLQNKSLMDAEIAKERAANIAAGKANVPYTQSDLYNRTVNRLQQIQGMQNMPQTTSQTGGGTTQPQTGGTGGQTTMPQTRFGSEADARAAGHQAGETVLIFDPATKQYRPATLQ